MRFKQYPDLKDIPVQEAIDDLSKISLVKVGEWDDWIYREPEPVVDKQKLLKQLGGVIPAFLPGEGYRMIVNISTTEMRQISAISSCVKYNILCKLIFLYFCFLLANGMKP